MTDNAKLLSSKRFFSVCACGQEGDHDHRPRFQALLVPAAQDEKPLKSPDDMRKDAVTQQLAASFDIKML